MQKRWHSVACRSVRCRATLRPQCVCRAVLRQAQAQKRPGRVRTWLWLGLLLSLCCALLLFCLPCCSIALLFAALLLFCLPCIASLLLLCMLCIATPCSFVCCALLLSVLLTWQDSGLSPFYITCPLPTLVRQWHACLNLYGLSY